MSQLSLLANGGGGGGGFFSIGILLLIPLALYFLMIRPQRRRMREQQSLQSSLEIGDEVLTTAGIFGFITGFDGNDRLWLEIDDDVQIRVARGAVQGKVDTSKDADGADPGDDAVDSDAATRTDEADRGADT